LKIRMRQNKRRGTTSISFRASNSREGEAMAKVILDLKTNVKDVDSNLPTRIVNGLIAEGIEKADFDLKIVEPKRKAST